jgi:hypothetical protein
VSLRVARAAEACVQAGSVAEGVEVSMDIEQLIYEAGRLHDAVFVDASARSNITKTDPLLLFAPDCGARASGST